MQQSIIKNQIYKNELLKFLPFHANSLKEYEQEIKKKIGILFIYKEKDLETLNHIIDSLFKYHDMLLILETHFVTYSAVNESEEVEMVI